MARAIVFAIYTFLFYAGYTFAQGFPTKPVTLYSSAWPNDAADQYLRSFAPIASKYLGQPVIVDNKPGQAGMLNPAKMAETERADGHSLAPLPITAFRLPHLYRVSWDPTRDFTYVIGLVRYTIGVVVKSDSQFKDLDDLINFAKLNPGKLTYGTPVRGGTPHLAMAELGLKTGAKFNYVMIGGEGEAAKALIDGRIAALADLSMWGPLVDAGTFRLLVTFGEGRSRWNAPTARDMGIDVVSYSPFGIVGPKGMDPKVVKLLHDAFNRALDDADYAALLKRLDMVDWYKSSEDYADWAVDQFRFQRALIERTIGLGRN